MQKSGIWIRGFIVVWVMDRTIQKKVQMHTFSKHTENSVSRKIKSLKLSIYHTNLWVRFQPSPLPQLVWLLTASNTLVVLHQKEKCKQKQLCPPQQHHFHSKMRSSLHKILVYWSLKTDNIQEWKSILIFASWN
jgi:hypothetical protein